MFHKITHLLKFFHNPPPPGSPEFRHLQQMLEMRHVLDAAGCLRRAFRHGWRFCEVRMCLDRYTQLRLAEGTESWTPGRLYDHLNLAPRGVKLTSHPTRTEGSELAERYGIARGGAA